MNDRKKALSERIHDAQNDMNTWPQWMKDAARFEGTRTRSWHPETSSKDDHTHNHKSSRARDVKRRDS